MRRQDNQSINCNFYIFYHSLKRFSNAKECKPGRWMSMTTKSIDFDKNRNNRFLVPFFVKQKRFYFYLQTHLTNYYYYYSQTEIFVSINTQKKSKEKCVRTLRLTFIVIQRERREQQAPRKYSLSNFAIRQILS